MWSLDVFPTSTGSAFKQLLVVASVFVGFFAAVKYITPERPAIPRTYPYSGLVRELGGVEENKVRVLIFTQIFLERLLSYLTCP